MKYFFPLERKDLVFTCEAVLIPSTIFKHPKYTLSKGQMHKEFKQSFSKWQIIRGSRCLWAAKDEMRYQEF